VHRRGSVFSTIYVVDPRLIFYFVDNSLFAKICLALITDFWWQMFPL